MGGVTLRPAGLFDAMDFAGARPFLRKVLVFQVRNCQSWIVERQGRVLVMAMFYPVKARLVEMALVFRPEAAAAMTALVRLMQLTLRRFAHDGILVFARLRESDARARRMARLTGMRPGRFRDGSIWIFKGGRECQA